MTDPAYIRTALAAQLGLRLQLLTGNEMPWFSKDTPPGRGG